MTRCLLPLLSLSAACVVSAPKPVDTGDDEVRADSGEAPEEQVDDTLPPDDTPDTPPADTDRPTTSGDVACYLGPTRGFSTCLDLVPEGNWGADYAYPSPSDARYVAPTHFLDLVDQPPDTRLAPNFVLSELAQVWKGEFAVVQPHFVERLQALRDNLGGPLIVNSAYRNPAYNDQIGGALRSRHMWGDAGDLFSSLADIPTLGSLCEAYDAGYVQLYEGHVHCDWRNDALDGVFFQDPLASLRLSEPPALRAELVPGPLWTAPAEGFDEGEPYRAWSAYDADGTVLLRASGRTFRPPPGATRVEVQVGGRVTVSRAVRP